MSFFQLKFLYRPYKGVLYEKRHSRNTEALGAKIGCDAFVKDIEGVAANGKTKLQQGRKT